MSKALESVSRLSAIALAVALSFTSTAFAQDAVKERGSGVHDQSNKGNRDAKKVEDEINKQPPNTDVVIDSPQADIDLSAISDQKILTLNKIDFSAKSKVLTDADLDSIIKPFIGKRVSLRDLHVIRLGIDKAYDQKGFIARALLPNQEPKNGIVKMMLVEGVVGKIHVNRSGVGAGAAPKTWGEHFDKAQEEKSFRDRSGFYLDTLDVAEGDLLHIKRIENALIRFNMLNDAKLRLQLGQGQNQGESDIQLFVSEPEPFEFAYYFDNAGRESTGKYRHGLTSTVRNLTGRGDSLFLNGLHTTGGGSTNGYVSYTLPVTTEGTRLTLSYDHNVYEIIKGANVALDIDGKSQTITAGLAQPFIIDRNQLLNAYTNVSLYSAKSYFAGVARPRDRLMTVTPGFSYEKYDDKHTFITDHSLAFGLTDSGYDEAYTVYRNSFTYVYRPVRTWSIVGRAVGQLTKDKNLPAQQQFIVGGVSSVRGYSEGVLSGDDGYYLRLEVRKNIKSGYFGPVQNGKTKNLDGFVFFDHGGAFPFKGAGESVDENDFVASVGGGLAADLLGHFSSRVTLAVPLKGTDEDLNYESIRVHFYIQFNY